MGQSAQDGQFGLIAQAVKGTPTADVGAVTSVWVPRTSGGIGTQSSLISLDAEIGGSRNQRVAAMGPVSYSGDVEFYARPRAFAFFAEGALGANVRTGAGPYVNTITQAATLPWWTAQEDFGASLDSHRFTDVMVNTLHLEVEPDGYLMCTAGLLALTNLAGYTREAAPNWDPTPVMTGTNADLLIDGVTYCAQSWSFDYSNNIEADVFCLGANTQDALTPKQVECTMGVTLRPDDVDLFRQANFGTTAATGPLGGLATRVPVSMIVTTEAAQSITITVPDMVIEPFEMSPSGDDVIDFTFTLRALEPAAGEMITIVVDSAA